MFAKSEWTSFRCKILLSSGRLSSHNHRVYMRSAKSLFKFCILINDKFSHNDIISLPKPRMDAEILHLDK